MQKKTYSIYVILTAVFLAIFCLSFFNINRADACHKGFCGFTGKPCGNFYYNGKHEPGSDACAILGFQRSGASCNPPPPPPPTCNTENFCQAGNVWTQVTDCSTYQYQVCLSGCGNGACLAPSAPTPGGTCVPNQPCTSAPNACGMTNGVKACSTNICVPPSNSLCKNASCTGPDGVTIASGDSRVYYSSVTSCSGDVERTCTNGVLSGSSKDSSSDCTDNSGELPVITTFRMAPNTVNLNDKCTMVWEVNQAQDCTISGPGITALNAKLPSGTALTASTTASNLYTLTCSNTKGTVSKTAICRLNPNTIEQ